MARGQIWQNFPKLLRFMALFPSLLNLDSHLSCWQWYKRALHHVCAGSSGRRHVGAKAQRKEKEEEEEEEKKKKHVQACGTRVPLKNFISRAW